MELRSIDTRLRKAFKAYVPRQELAPPAKKTWKKFGLILTGGCARGAIEVGALKTLWKHGIIPDVIIGSSVGAINGGIIASGRTPDELALIWSYMSKEMLFPFNYGLLWKLGKVPSLAKTGNIKKVIRFGVKVDYFEECKIPLHLIATRLSDGEAIFFTKGPIHQAILASLSIPPYYPPVIIDNITYSDGSISGVNGVKKALELGCDKIIILNATNSMKKYSFGGILDVINQSLNIMFQKNIVHEMDVCASPFGNTDILLIKAPDVDIDTTDFSRTSELIRLGEEKTEELLREKGIIK